MRRYEIFPAPCIWANSELLEVPMFMRCLVCAALEMVGAGYFSWVQRDKLDFCRATSQNNWGTQNNQEQNEVSRQLQTASAQALSIIH